MSEGIIPRFACICSTHNRPLVLPEAIESFQRQTYHHRKLIILDDACQYQGQEGDRWHLIPFPYQFKTIGAKHDFVIRHFISKEINCIAIWDDDDIHLPNRLEILAEILAKNDVAVCSHIAFRFSDKHIGIIPAEDNHFHFGGYRLQAYYEVGGYSPKHVGEDKDLANRLFQSGFTFGKTEEIVQLYRWCSPYAHLATAGTPDDYPLAQLSAVPQHKIQPHWKENYAEIIEKVLLHDKRIRNTALWYDHLGNPLPVIDPDRFPSISSLIPHSDSPASLIIFYETGIRKIEIHQPSRIVAGMTSTSLENGRSVSLRVNGQPFGEVRYPGQVIQPFILQPGSHLIETSAVSKFPSNPFFISCSPCEQETANEKNTLFLTVAAWKYPEKQIEVFSKSAKKFGIPVEYLDYGEKWENFYIHKIIRLQKYLTEAQSKGKKFVFILDCRDLLFTAPLETILAKFNGLYDGRLLFGRDLIGCVWPCQSQRLLAAIQVTNGFYSILNGGTIAGSIHHVREFHQRCIEIHDELEKRIYRPGIIQTLAGNILPEYIKEDQFLFQVASVYYPELIHVDINKVLFATFANSYPDLTNRSWEDPRNNGSVLFAPILHSPWISRNHDDWRAWAEKNGIFTENIP